MIIIGITGTLGAGKGTVVDYLLKNKGFVHYSMSGYITEEIVKRKLPVNRDSMVLVANELRTKFGPGYIAEQLYEQAKQEGKNCIIESLRTVGEIEGLDKKGNFTLLAVDADPKLRYERAEKRKSEKDGISFETFIEHEKREMNSTDHNKQNLFACMKIAHHVIENNGTLDELHKQIDEILKKIEFVVDNKTNNTTANPQKIEKRKEFLSWDEYFMGIAILSAQRSKDPSTQVGACIIDTDKKIVGIGYNGFPIGCSDEELPWAREGNFLDTKYPYVCHAELNAILNSTKSLKECTIYVALFPCNECAKLIIQSGIKKIIYLSDKYAETDSVKASKKMLNQSGIIYEQLIPTKKEINLKLSA